MTFKYVLLFNVELFKNELYLFRHNTFLLLLYYVTATVRKSASSCLWVCSVAVSCTQRSLYTTWSFNTLISMTFSSSPLGLAVQSTPHLLSLVRSYCAGTVRTTRPLYCMITSGCSCDLSSTSGLSGCHDERHGGLSQPKWTTFHSEQPLLNNPMLSSIMYLTTELSI